MKKGINISSIDSNEPADWINWFIVKIMVGKTGYNYFIIILLFNNRNVIKMIFGERVYNALGGFFNWVLYKRNPLLQIFYLAVMVGGYYFAWKDIFPLVPCRYLGTIHRTIGTVLFLIALLSFFIASYVEPGIITKENLKEYIFYYIE